jgi:AbrB family looped-hinge helix DNA binding protein
MRRLVKKLKRGQLTIPKEFRDAMGIAADDRLMITLEDGKLSIEPARLTMTMGSPWLKGVYEQIVPGPESAEQAPVDDARPAADAPGKPARRRRARDR